MGLRVFFIAVITYILGMLDTAGLIGRYVMNENLGRQGKIGYVQFFKRYHWKGLGYLALADFLRALVAILVGGILMKHTGFPSVGKQLGLFFALLGQAMPLNRQFQPKEDLIFPAMMLLFVDWRICLICVGAGLLLMVLIGKRPIMLSAVILLYPILIIVFGGWWLKVILALVSSLVIFHIYKYELLRFYQQIFSHVRSRREAPQETDEAVENADEQ